MIYGLCITLALANRDSTTRMEGSTFESNGGSKDGQSSPDARPWVYGVRGLGLPVKTGLEKANA